MAKVGVVLSGCGVYDGAEIQEAVLTMLALDEHGAEIVCLAPDVEQMHVVNHLNGDVTGETRNVLVESARIARGSVTDIAQVTADDLDALLFPGGFGAAKNLCNFAVEGAGCATHPEVARLVGEMHGANKPLGFACIAPALAAAIFRDAGVSGVNLTIGSDEGTAAAIEEMGAVHLSCPVREARFDETNKVVTTPAYMLAGRITEVRDSVKSMVDGVLGML